MAESTDGERVLVGEAKRTCSAREARSALDELARKASAAPALEGRRVDVALFVLRERRRLDDPRVIDGGAVLSALR